MIGSVCTIRAHQSRVQYAVCSTVWVPDENRVYQNVSAICLRSTSLPPTSHRYRVTRRMHHPLPCSDPSSTGPPRARCPPPRVSPRAARTQSRWRHSRRGTPRGWSAACWLEMTTSSPSSQPPGTVFLAAAKACELPARACGMRRGARSLQVAQAGRRTAVLREGRRHFRPAGRPAVAERSVLCTYA